MLRLGDSYLLIEASFFCMFILVKNSGAQMLLLNKIATKIQELSTFVNKKLPFISTFHYASISCEFRNLISDWMLGSAKNSSHVSPLPRLRPKVCPDDFFNGYHFKNIL